MGEKKQEMNIWDDPRMPVVQAVYECRRCGSKRMPTKFNPTNMRKCSDCGHEDVRESFTGGRDKGKKDVTSFREWMTEQFIFPEWDKGYSRSDVQAAWNAGQESLIRFIHTTCSMPDKPTDDHADITTDSINDG